MAFQYFLNLESEDVRLAHHIAHVVNREFGAALADCRGCAEPVRLEVTIKEPRLCPLLELRSRVKLLAQQVGVKLGRGYLRGEVPLAALLAVMEECLDVAPLETSQIIFPN